MLPELNRLNHKNMAPENQISSNNYINNSLYSTHFGTLFSQSMIYLQDALFFLRKFFIDLSGGSAPSPHSKSVPVPESPVGSPKPGTASSSTPPAPPAPVMAVNLSPEEESEQDQQDLLIMFDEMNLESNAGLNQELTESTSSSTGSDHGSQPVFFKLVGLNML